jgi:DHA1 family inner membrane transport protein
MAQQTHHAVISDAVGPDLPLSEGLACIALGVISLLLAGVLPSILGALSDEHRLSASGIGLTATFESLSMALATVAASTWLPPTRLKLTAAVGLIALAVADFATMHTQGSGVMLARSVAGLPEGILLWIMTSMIARTRTPERWAGIFFTVSTASQLVIAFAFARWVLPQRGADGGFAGLALTSIAGLALLFWIPARLAPLPKPKGETGMPPPRGQFALLATLVYVGAASTVGIYIQPLAHEAGLDADVARTAVWISLAAQIAGGLSATLLAGHVRYFTAFVAATITLIAVWAVFLLHPQAWLFIAANAAGGLMGLFMAPFLIPMTIEADPSRRGAVLSGGTQVLAGALGPFATSFVVGDSDVHGAIYLGTAGLLVGIVLIAALHFTTSHSAIARNIREV